MSVTQVEVGVGRLAALLHELPAAGVFVVADERAAAAHPAIGAAVDARTSFVVPSGEEHKTWATAEALLLALDAAGIDRDGLVLGVGGGVTTDLAGFAASLHRRGVGWIAAPTTVVGAVDAALGGKTAVNLGGGKNTVGTFHEPLRVVADPSTLTTLDPRHVRAGLAEVLKTALIAGGEAWDSVLALDLAFDLDDAWTDATVADFGAIIERCLATKLDLVTRDLHDVGPRRTLNLGHTFGHAFEALALPELLHGEAVALGLICAARAANNVSLETTIRERLKAWQLPLSPPPPARDVDALLTEMLRDKKRAGGQHTLIVPHAPGDVRVEEGVKETRIRKALAAVLEG